MRKEIEFVVSMLKICRASVWELTGDDRLYQMFSNLIHEVDMMGLA